MVFLWFSYGFPMVFLWFSHGCRSSPDLWGAECRHLTGAHCGQLPGESLRLHRGRWGPGAWMAELGRSQVEKKNKWEIYGKWLVIYGRLMIHDILGNIFIYIYIECFNGGTHGNFDWFDGWWMVFNDWLVVTGTWILLFFHINWEWNNHPNWRAHIFAEGLKAPTRYRMMVDNIDNDNNK